MATFTGRTPSNTYKNLLNVDNSNSGVDATLRSIQDGEGTTMLWSVSTTAMTYTGAASFSNMTITGGSVTGITDLALADGGTNASLTASNGGIFYSTATAGAILSGTATANKMLLSGSSAAPTWSTSTIPSSAGATAGKILVSDGTNYILSTPTFPNSSVTSGKLIVSDGTNWIASTPTFPNASATSGKLIISDGTNWIASTPTYPNAASTSGKILQSDGTNFVTSTNTLTLSSNTTLNGGTHSGTNTGDQTPGGSNTQLQYNNSSSFGGTANWTYNSTGDVITGTGQFNIDNLRLDGNTISSTNSNGHINLTPNGTGQVVRSNQACFSADMATSYTDVTGDGTLYTVIFEREKFDVQGGYNNSTGTYTFPYAGKWIICSSVYLSELGAAHTLVEMSLFVNATQRYLFHGNPGAMRSSTNQLNIGHSIIIDVAVNDTAVIKVKVSNGTKVVDILAGEFNGYFLG